ncbi:hypothetical protein A1O3_10281 [Capronia epimyces CBS 606.96]|uniref:Major facilitator superfamily (MFS) profile domain-containing protein n=1 Tax=Capronia epimyces CBS 606.96 TaxID=1182542 RepID=W9XA63_9EURO|nr:uncharacterized protein A1O3_10281 [Capronia epimyces CBS 606.96]EXJ77123.1 hypothetical protein A1O3_10281 [Capronia epimyces CBS 606.96]
MSQMLQHSSLSALIRVCVQRRYSPSPWHDPEKIPNLPSERQAVKGEEGPVTVVGWDGPNDIENPQNFSPIKKVFITAFICVFTWSIYVGSAIYTPSQPGIEEAFAVNHLDSTLGLALYVLAYGLGGLVFSPLSEVPLIGRNPPYAISGLLFVILCIPTSLVDNYAGLMVLRFLLGFMGSPCLATAGATLGDIWAPEHFPYAIGLWAATTSCGPALGPLLSSFAVDALGWRFSSWELLIISGSVYAVFMVFLPETAAPTILYYRAKRLRELTGDLGFKSQQETDQAHLTVGGRLRNSLIKPWEVNIKDWALLFMTLYMGLIYAILYSFFESLPLVYPVMYGFSPTSTSLIWLVTAPAVTIGFFFHCVWLSKRVQSKIQRGTFGELEGFLEMGVVGGILMPLSLFMFAWTARPSIHWMVPTTSIFLYMLSQYFITNSVFLYIPNIYPRYAASIFAANSVSRSALAFAAVLVGRPLFEGLGVNGGVSLLAGLTVICAGLITGLYWSWGKKLRARSRFATS